MNHKTPKIIKVINYPLFGEKTEDIILFDNGKFRDEPIEIHSNSMYTTPIKQANWKQTLDTEFIVNLGGSLF